MFDRRSTLTALLPKLVRSYAVDALEVAEGTAAPPDGGLAAAFFDAAASANVSSHPALGLGTDIRLTGPGLAGGGLVVEDGLVHLAVFAVEDEAPGERSQVRGMASVRTRRRSVQRR